ncbi:MAG: hypothetical protein GXO61_04725 [Epsilonproteobacteria bacterium]|nr:hypothetical protein [Campylobacterota bacterium]
MTKQRDEELLSLSRKANLLKKRLLALLVRYSGFLFIIVLLAIYIGRILFGPNSVEVLYNLSVQEKTLKRKIEFYKRANARLQKEYFELKELEPQGEE